MSELPFFTFGMQPEDVDAIIAIYDQVKEPYSAKFNQKFSADFSPFEIFGKNLLHEEAQVLELNNQSRSFHLAFLEMKYDVYSGKYNTGSASEIQSWGMLNLGQDFGHIVIREETLIDKIHELINPIELDFEEDPAFSKRFFVLTDDKDKAFRFLNQSMRFLIMSLPEDHILIEVVGNQLLIGNKKIVQKEFALSAINFMDKASIAHR